MMTPQGDILLVGEQAVVAPLRAQLGAARAAALADPYAAMQALHGRPFQSVVVAAPQAELPGLCRALRRLHPAGPLVAVGPVGSEPDMRSLTPRPLDDYYINPLRPADLEAIRSGRVGLAPLGGAVAAAPASALARQVLSTPQLAGLITSATSPANLQETLVQLLAAQGVPARWIPADELAPGQAPLLTINGELNQVLVATQKLPLTPAVGELLALLSQLLGPLLGNARRIESLHKLAITDHLTGAYNRRYFYHLTDQVLSRAAKAGFRVTLLLYDIDNFKHYNETYGHAAGDEILRETAALMKKTSRSHDVVARIGGDEFAVLFWDAEQPRSPHSKPLESFAVLADRFRRTVGSHSFPSLGPEATGVLSISGGLANYPSGGQTCRDLLRTADGGLRAAKRQGKNRIFLIGQE